jgi:hypothetical protein
MQSSECNGIHQPAGWKDSKGVLWFPTMMGVVSVSPLELPMNPLSPPVNIEQFTVDRAVMKTGPEDVMIPAGSRDIQFDYAAMSFVSMSA